MAMNNSLAEVPPELITEWSEKNLPLTPDDITFGSHTMQRFITDERTGIRYELIGDYYYPCLTVEESPHLRQVFKKSLSREYNRSGRKVISYIGCNFFMTLLTRKLGMCIIKICKENLAWRCFYEKGRNLKCKQKRTSQ